MRIFLSYAKSHIYDIHAVLTAVIAIIMMQYVKRPIKKQIAKSVDGYIMKRNKDGNKRATYIKRANLLIILFTLILSFLIFMAVSIISPLIDFSMETAIMSGVSALAGYALWSQITYNKKDKI